jgi:carboxylate-amine ligase
MSNTEEFTIGVEEEYQIIKAETRELHSEQQSILPGARAAVGDRVTPELYLSQMQY